MLLSHEKVTEVTYGTIDGEQSRDDRYLLPLSAVDATGNAGTVFVAKTDENNKTIVSEVTVNIKRVMTFIMR